jgi:hypothetical protein
MPSSDPIRQADGFAANLAANAAKLAGALRAGADRAPPGRPPVNTLQIQAQPVTRETHSGA